MISSVRDTSLMAYFEVEPELVGRQAHVFSVLEERGPLSNSELAEVLGWGINRVTPRIFELRRLGRVVMETQRSCRVTGRMVYVWRAV